MQEALVKAGRWIALRGLSGHFEEHVRVTSKTQDPAVLCHGSHLYVQDAFLGILRRLEEGESFVGLLAAYE